MTRLVFIAPNVKSELHRALGAELFTCAVLRQEEKQSMNRQQIPTELPASIPESFKFHHLRKGSGHSLGSSGLWQSGTPFPWTTQVLCLLTPTFPSHPLGDALLTSYCPQKTPLQGTKAVRGEDASHTTVQLAMD
jgi:hypothetical protein